MKLKITMKDPDCLDDTIREEVEDQLNCSDLDEGEAQAVAKVRIERFRKICAKWFQDGEYLTVIVDTDKETIEVEEA